jgi:hypothetical protein
LHIGQALHSEGDFFQRHIQLRSVKFDLCKSLNLSKNGRFMIIRFYFQNFPNAEQHVRIAIERPTLKSKNELYRHGMPWS